MQVINVEFNWGHSCTLNIKSSFSFWVRDKILQKNSYFLIPLSLQLDVVEL